MGAFSSGAAIAAGAAAGRASGVTASAAVPMERIARWNTEQISLVRPAVAGVRGYGRRTFALVGQGRRAAGGCSGSATVITTLMIGAQRGKTAQENRW